MLNRTESVKNKIVDFVTAGARLKVLEHYRGISRKNKESLFASISDFNAKDAKCRQENMRTAYANRRKIKFVISPLL